MSKEAQEKIAELIDRKYGKLIEKLAYGIIEDYDLSEDVKQDVLIKCARQYKTIEGLNAKQMYAYVCTATRNTAINLLQKMIHEREKKERYTLLNHVDLTMDYVDFKAFEEKLDLSDEMLELLSTLDKVDRSIILMKFYIGMSNAETAEAMNMTVEGVKKRFQRAKTRLKSRVYETEGDEIDE